MSDSKVLIVGAGPTGLVLALRLAHQGIGVRIIDKNSEPGQASRAIAVHARTLEFYDQLGFADEAVRRGFKAEAIVMRRGATPAARVRLGNIGTGVSPYPFVLMFAQDDHERLLIEQLHAVGVEVERQTELTAFVDHGDYVSAVLKKGDTQETFATPYICGCDGARSTVRHLIGVEFPGGTYEQIFFVADVQGTGGAADGNVDVCVTWDGFCIVMPLRRHGAYRLIGIVPTAYQAKANLTFDDVANEVPRFTGVTVERVHWFSTYQVHHRVANHFRRGRAFLLGDAGHIHSPAGGQGMNTGIGDAVNLSWKLADGLRGRAGDSLLDTYEAERIGFARRLVSSTDRLFQIIASRSIIGKLWRMNVLPYVLPLLTSFDAARRLVFKTVSQTNIRYRKSPISAGTAGQVHGGDRLPWVRFDEVDNFTPLKTLDWQIHVYGTVAAPLRAAAHVHGLALHEFRWSDHVSAAGLTKDALYLVRPDGYVAFVESMQDVASLTQFLSENDLNLAAGRVLPGTSADRTIPNELPR